MFAKLRANQLNLFTSVASLRSVTGFPDMSRGAFARVAGARAIHGANALRIAGPPGLASVWAGDPLSRAAERSALGGACRESCGPGIQAGGRWRLLPRPQSAPVSKRHAQIALGPGFPHPPM